jgi:cobalt/nickel transport system permease protein
MVLYSYSKKDHFLRKVDGRLKIIVLVFSLIMVLCGEGIVFPLFITGVCLLMSLHAGVTLKRYLLRFSEPLFIGLVILIIKFLSQPNGMNEGMRIFLRIVASVSLVNLFTFTTDFTDIIEGLSWFRLPKTFIDVLLFAWRYVFVLLEEAFVIYNAQKNRLGYISIKRGLNSFGILTGSLVIKAFEHADNIALSMMQRGYDGKPVSMRYRVFKKVELIGTFLVVLIMVLLWRA